MTEKINRYILSVFAFALILTAILYFVLVAIPILLDIDYEGEEFKITKEECSKEFLFSIVEEKCSNGKLNTIILNKEVPNNTYFWTIEEDVIYETNDCGFDIATFISSENIYSKETCEQVEVDEIKYLDEKTEEAIIWYCQNPIIKNEKEYCELKINKSFLQKNPEWLGENCKLPKEFKYGMGYNLKYQCGDYQVEVLE